MRSLRNAGNALNRAHMMHTCVYWDAETTRLRDEARRATDAYVEALAAREAAYVALDAGTNTAATDRVAVNEGTR